MADEASKVEWKDPGPTVREPVDLTPRGGCAGSPTRMNARATLQDRIQRLRREADHLEALNNLLPMQIPPEADEALWLLLAARKI